MIRLGFSGLAWDEKSKDNLLVGVLVVMQCLARLYSMNDGYARIRK